MQQYTCPACLHVGAHPKTLPPPLCDRCGYGITMLPSRNGRILSADESAMTAEAKHWKNNHDVQVRAARILKERLDMPLERVQAYNEVLALRRECKRLQILVDSLSSRLNQTGGNIDAEHY